jgi:hypothetical protein
MKYLLVVVAAVTTSAALVVPTVGQAQIAGLGKTQAVQQSA